MRTSPPRMPATSVPNCPATSSVVIKPVFTISWSRMLRMAARRMPISSATMMAVCRLLMMGLSPKLSRWMHPLPMASASSAPMRSMSSVRRLSPTRSLSCCMSESACCLSSGVKNEVGMVSIICYILSLYILTAKVRKNEREISSLLRYLGKFIRDGVILTKRSGGRISRKDFSRCFTSFNMTRDVLDNCYIITYIYHRECEYLRVYRKGSNKRTKNLHSIPLICAIFVIL